MKLIEIGERNYLLYRVLPHALKMALLSRESRARLDRINSRVNEHVFSGDRATEYERIHRYEDDAQHEYPARVLVTEVWSSPGRGAGEGGYDRALELGAGSGYFTALIARRARTVIAAELVADLRRVVRERCAAERLDNVEVIGATAFDLGGDVPAGSIDSARAFTISIVDRRCLPSSAELYARAAVSIWLSPTTTFGGSFASPGSIAASNALESSGRTSDIGRPATL